MRSQFLYIAIAFLVGVLIPHIRNIFNTLFSGNWEGLMNEFAVTWQPVIVLAPLIIITALVLWYLDKKNERKHMSENRKDGEKLDLILNAIKNLTNEIRAERKARSGKPTKTQ